MKYRIDQLIGMYNQATAGQSADDKPSFQDWADGRNLVQCAGCYDYGHLGTDMITLNEHQFVCHNSNCTLLTIAEMLDFELTERVERVPWNDNLHIIQVRGDLPGGRLVLDFSETSQHSERERVLAYLLHKAKLASIPVDGISASKFLQ